MARKISPAIKPKRHRKEVYPWDTWFDGSQYSLHVGIPTTEAEEKKFDIHAKSTKNASLAVRKAAKRRKGMQVSVLQDGPHHILVQATTKRKK